MQFIMVLNDGETFSPMQGCKIISCKDRLDLEDIEDLLDEETARLVCQFAGDVPSDLVKDIEEALNSESNDDEHDALVAVGELFGLVQRPFGDARWELVSDHLPSPQGS